MEDIISKLPFEIRDLIFKQLSGITLFKYRLVSKEWKLYIDSNDTLWQDLCKRDYPHASLMAKQRCNLNWRDIYKNLTLWPDLSECSISMRVFYTFPVQYKKHIIGLDNGLLFIKSSKGTLIYDMVRAEYAPFTMVQRSNKISSNAFATVVQIKNSINLVKDTDNGESYQTFTGDDFLLLDNDLCFCNDGIFYKFSFEKATVKRIITCEYDVVDMKYYNKFIHIFTRCGKIFSFSNRNNIGCKCINCPEPWLDCLKKFSLLDNEHFIAYNSDNLFYIESGDYKHVFLDFVNVTTLFFYGDNVIIGTKNSEVLLYRLSNQQQSSKPIFDKIASLPKGYAINIDVHETLSGPVIIVLTQFRIYFIDVVFDQSFKGLEPCKEVEPNVRTILSRLAMLNKELYKKLVLTYNLKNSWERKHDSHQGYVT